MPVSHRSDVDALNEPFVRALLDPAHGQIQAGNVAVVIAHPDDETIGCGALLGRMRNATVILVTDGAPRNGADAKRYGFATPAAYAAHRLDEIESALAIAGVDEDDLITLAIADQDAARHLVRLTTQLADICVKRGINVVLTHAYEGGHPDHDATAFAVHAVAHMLADTQPILILEMPFYWLGEATACYQQFVPERNRIQITVPLDEDERGRKRRMMEAHDSQKSVLAPFHLSSERFRPARPYDFSKLPNDGRLLYEMFNWGLDGACWSSLTRAALDELRLEVHA